MYEVPSVPMGLRWTSERATMFDWNFSRKRYCLRRLHGFLFCLIFRGRTRVMDAYYVFYVTCYEVRLSIPL